MKYRQTLLLAEKSITSAGTETIDIRVKKPISRITIAWRTVKSKNAMDAHPAKDITKIALIDGSFVLHSLSGYMNQALCIYNRKVPTMCYGQHIAASYEYSWYGLDFGRKLWDTQLAFDPTKFQMPQLQITHNLALSDTGVTQAYMEVFADVFDEKPVSPIGFLLSKEHYSYTPSTDGTYEYIKMPTDHPYRQLLIRAFEAGYDPHETIEKMKLDEDNDARIPYDIDLEDYNRMNKGINSMVIEPLAGYISSSETDHIYYITPTDMTCAVAGHGHVAAGYTIGINTYPRGGKVILSASADCMFTGMAHGWLPNSTMQIPFGLQDDPDDWYDVRRVGDLRLRLEAGARGATGTCQVAIQQLRKY